MESLFDSKTAKVLDWFILHEKWEQNQKDLCKWVDIYPRKMKKILERLVKLDLIVETKKIAKSRFYQFNPASKVATPLRVLHQELVMFFAKQEADRQIAMEMEGS